MKLGNLLILLIASIFSFSGYAQDYHVQFQEYCDKNEPANQLKVLNEWEKVSPKDPELITSYFNYYFLKSKKEGITMSKVKPKGDSFVLKDSSNQVAGYLGSQIHYNISELQKGIKKINTGIELYPNRLDMRFGKIYVFAQIKDWERFTSEIITTIKYSATNDNNWTWTNSEKQENGKDFFLLSLQDYQLMLYDTGDNNLLINMREIAKEILIYYPNHIESFSNLSVTYLLTGEYDKGIEILLKAEKIKPEDYIVLSNIARGYSLKGNKEKAIEYYEKTFKFGDEQAKVFAKKQIAELKK